MSTHLHDLEAQLAHRGWLFHHQRGSHRRYVHQKTGRKLTISLHGGEHTPLCWRKLAAIRRDLRRLEEGDRGDTSVPILRG